MKGLLPGSTTVAESVFVSRNGLFTDFCRKVDRFGSAKTALCSNPAKLGVKNRIEQDSAQYGEDIGSRKGPIHV